jgi:hypothetical protein
MKSKLITLFVLLALLLLPTGNAYAQSPDGDVVLVGEDYIVKSGETLNGSVVIVGGNLVVEDDAKVSKDVVVIGGNLMLDGNAAGNVVVIGGNAVSSAKVSGDMVAIGGQIDLKKTATVKGNVVLFGGQISREEGAEVSGEVVENTPPMNIPDAPGAPNPPTPPWVTNYGYVNPLWEIASQFGKAIIIAGVAMLVALFLQPQMERVSDTIVKQPFMAGSYGLLTVIIAPLAILIMVITIILIPIAAIVALVIMPAIWIFGMIALGQELGERFTKAINQVWSPIFTTGLGTFLLVFTLGALSTVPPVECIGALLSMLVSLVVIGGVLKAWFESRNAPKPSAPAPVVVEVPPAS